VADIAREEARRVGAGGDVITAGKTLTVVQK